MGEHPPARVLPEEPAGNMNFSLPTLHTVTNVFFGLDRAAETRAVLMTIKLRRDNVLGIRARWNRADASRVV
jgi:hypothetical protein